MSARNEHVKHRGTEGCTDISQEKAIQLGSKALLSSRSELDDIGIIVGIGETQPQEKRCPTDS